MAFTRTSLFVSFSILLGFLSIASQARPGRPFHPCNTLIIFSTTTTTSSFPLDQNPNFESQNPFLQSSYSNDQSITFLFTEVRRVLPNRLTIPSEPSNFIDREEIQQEKLPFPFDLYSSSSVGASFLDRTNDILSVVGSLLFGVGCGALTSLILYMIWSLFAPNHFEFLDSEDESDEEFESDPKKMGYVSIPAKGDLIAVPVAKEVC
ncbi:uncharacterized protein LOC124932106 [Impatiens glandulifera]|uniref:uncharacterized protein LOC124932106 n=1 Tax=Impatiens glandulifera TaxID=253017 RepID=UPI001FB07566|nr:uncharacterized protein LOC124932106 [Impatiens glandulifera]